MSEKITAPDGELQTHRLAVNQLASQALENQATIETLRTECAWFEELRGPLAQLQELSKNTKQRLTSLTALAEHVSQKATALEGSPDLLNSC